MAERPGFMLYFADLEAVRKHLAAEQLGRLFGALIDYAKSEIEPEFKEDHLLSFAFDTMRPKLDRDSQEYERKSEKNRANARKRWDKGSMPDNAMACDSINGNANDANTNTNTKNNSNTKKKRGADKPPTRPRFSPPSVEEVAEYVKEKGYHINPHAFVNHYEAVGWKVGKNSMKNWKAAVNTWENREKGAEHGQLEGRTRNDIPKIPNPLEGYFD